MKPRRYPFPSGAVAAAVLSAVASTQAQSEQPNILWIIADDISLDLGCYGNKDVTTPHLDRLAAQGTRFTAAFTTAPSCAPSRSAFQTGAYQTRIDAQHQRSHRDGSYMLPPPHMLLSHRFREAGYHTANIKRITADLTVPGKTDFNFRVKDAFDGADWSELKGSQPFFAQVNFTEPHRGDAWTEARAQTQLVDPASVHLPVDYPDHPITRDVWANYCDAINLLDKKVGVVLDLLDREGLAENTLVVFFGDNGRAMFRGKGTLYEAGIRVPLLVRWPGRIAPGSVRVDLVSAIDFAPAMLAAAGIPIPGHLRGRDFLAPDLQPREHVFAARDRIDEIEDTIRAVRTDRFKYIRNFRPARSALEDSAHTRRVFPEMEVFREFHRQRRLDPVQRSVVATRDEEELYDLETDPHEINNLVNHPDYRLLREMLHHVLMDWIVSNRDTGAVPEARVVMPTQWYERNNMPTLTPMETQ